jgi:hypothetical protein
MWKKPIYQDLVPGRMTMHPDLPDEELFEYNEWFTPTMEELIWYPGISDGLFDPAQAVGRIDLTRTEYADILSLLNDDTLPVIMVRVYPNILRTVPATRTDAAGVPDSAGNYLVLDFKAWGNDPQPYGSTRTGVDANGNPYRPVGNASSGRIAFCNLPLGNFREGRYATNPVAGWALYRDRAGLPTEYHRSSLKTGLGFAPQTGTGHIWIRGAVVGCVDGGTTITSTQARPGLRIEEIDHRGHGSYEETRCIGMSSPNTNSVIRHCTFAPTVRGSHINITGAPNNLFILCNKTTGGGDTSIFLNGAGLQNCFVLGNLVESANGGHGNGLSVYGNCYNVVLEDNIVKNCYRPWTNENSNSAYDEVLYGPASLILRRNYWLKKEDVDSSDWAMSWNEGSEVKGLQLIDEKIDGSLESKAFMLTNGTNAIGTGITTLGSLSREAPAFMSSNPTNVTYTASEAAAVSLRATWWAATVPTSVCPEGPGITW